MSFQQFSFRLSELGDKAIDALGSMIERIGDVRRITSEKEALLCAYERISELALEIRRLEEGNEYLLDSNNEILRENVRLKADLEPEIQVTDGSNLRSSEESDSVLSANGQTTDRITQNDPSPVLSEDEHDAITFAVNLMDRHPISDQMERPASVLRGLLNRCECV